MDGLLLLLYLFLLLLLLHHTWNGTDYFLVEFRALYSGDNLILLRCHIDARPCAEKYSSPAHPRFSAADIAAIQAEQSDRKWFLAAASGGLSFSSGLQS